MGMATPTILAGQSPAERTRLTLDETAIDAALRSLDQGAVTPHHGPWRDDVVRLFEDILSDEQEHAEELRDWLAE